ncbi:MAG TPA: dephospho-CoA kinase, partial [Chitinophagaceae bacterium]|nr:dephospho-CoA kinase [Chitinophagaceae bacterium]
HGPANKKKLVLEYFSLNRSLKNSIPQFNTYLYFHRIKTLSLLQIGITGGIGSGKSTICKMFKLLGIPIFDADSEAKKLYDQNNELKEFIQITFGKKIYPNGQFDRKALADIVFQSKEKLDLLNKKIHPMVQQQFELWMVEQQTNYVIKEAALLIESGSYKNLDSIILVSCPIEKRIERVVERDHASKEEILNRINKQMPEDQKRLFCKYEIVNNDHELVIPQVLKLHSIFNSIKQKKALIDLNWF